MRVRTAIFILLFLGAPLTLAEGQRAPSNLFWADYDGDGLLDAFALRAEGAGLLLRNTGRASFEDVTVAAGLSELRGAHMAAWADATGDGRLDLFLPSYDGASRLMVQTEAGTFVDVTTASGLPEHAEPIHAEWFDFDADGNPDLHLVTIYDELVYRNGGRAQFVKIDLGPMTRMPVDATLPRPSSLDEARVRNGLEPLATTSEPINVSDCGPPGIRDMALPNTCIGASTTPTLGLLYPLTSDLFVSAAGDVGIGTTTPDSKLEVAGAARAEVFRSTASAGTAPFMVSSPTLVAGLNVDLLDGFEGSDFRLLADPIGPGDLAPGSVTTSEILDGTIQSADLGAKSVGSEQIAPDAVGSEQIATGAVGTDEVMDQSLTAADLAADSVGSSEIATDAVRAPEIAPNAVGTSEVDDESLTAADLAADSVGFLEIATGAVRAPEIAPNAVGTSEVDDESLTADDLGPDSVGSSEVIDNSLTANDLGPDSVGSSELAPGAVDSSALMPGVIVDDLVAADAAIAGTKIHPFFGVQDLVADGNVSLAGALYIDSGALSLDTLLTLNRDFAAQSGTNTVHIRVPPGSSNSSQYIECESNDIDFRVDRDGDVFADGSYSAPADFAEMIEVSTGAASIEPGDVVAIDPERSRSVTISRESHSRLVAGVYSTDPGFVGSEREFDVEVDGRRRALKRSDMAEMYGEVPVAVIGIVPCKVTNEGGPIRPGDLLVTSSTPGHAMVHNTPNVGTVVGKALEPMDGPRGKIRVLITLQ